MYLRACTCTCTYTHYTYAHCICACVRAYVCTYARTRTCAHARARAQARRDVGGCFFLSWHTTGAKLTVGPVRHMWPQRGFDTGFRLGSVGLHGKGGYLNKGCVLQRVQLSAIAAVWSKPTGPLFLAGLHHGLRFLPSGFQGPTFFSRKQTAGMWSPIFSFLDTCAMWTH